MPEKEIFIYTPAALVNLFANSIQFEAAKEMKRVKGKFVQGKDFLYGDKYYDVLKDESSDASMTLLVPGLIRSTLQNNEIIELTGYLQKRVVNAGGRIELQLVVVDVVDQNKPSFNQDELQAFEILQKKRNTGYLDVDGFIKKQLLNDEKVSVDIFVGKTGIIHSDIEWQLKDSVGFYNIEFVPINLSNEYEIIEALQNSAADVIAIARGGGDRMEIFDKPTIAEAAINLDAYFVTALGHAQDVPLLQKVADKAFNTPTALGQHLNDLYNSVIDERSKSKAGIVEAVTKQMRALYDKEKNILEERLKAKDEALLVKTRELEIQIESNNLSGSGIKTWVVILIAIAAVFFGMVIAHYL